jgi:hypothetical protein
MKCQGLYLGSPCKDSWFEVDQRVINNECTGSGRPFGTWREPVEVLSGL